MLLEGCTPVLVLSAGQAVPSSPWKPGVALLLLQAAGRPAGRYPPLAGRHEEEEPGSSAVEAGTR